MDDVVGEHRRACDGFARTVAAADALGRWDAPSPCTEWDARAVLEHVIGFHEVLVLRPLGVRAHRPKDDPVGRWAATQRAIFDAVAIDGALDRTLRAVPGADDYVLRSLLPTLTGDVVVHTWDLARATGADETLDAELCTLVYERSVPNRAAMRASGTFGPAEPAEADADVQTRLLALFGRRR